MLIMENDSPETDLPALLPAVAPTIGFAYGELEPEVAQAVKAAADCIRRGGGSMAATIIEIGNALLKAKEQLGHGKFGAWLKAEFGWSERTAQRYMKAAEQFGGKPDIVSDLEPSAVYLLSANSTPPGVKDDVVRRLEEGSRLTTAEIKSVVRRARQNAANLPNQVATDRPSRNEGRAKARAAAKFIAEHLGDRWVDLLPQLDGVDGRQFLFALRSVRPRGRPVSELTL
jgi:hypothetical protein